MSSSDDFFVATGPAAIGFRAENPNDIAPVFELGVKAVGRTNGVFGQAGDTPAAPAGTFAGVLGTALDQPGIIGWSRENDGVQGASFTGNAVFGASFHGVGVRAVSGNIAIRGLGKEVAIFGESVAGGTGVAGVSGGFGPGHLGPVTTSPAVLGSSAFNPGTVGASSAHIGVYGQSGDAKLPAAGVPGIAGVVGSSAAQPGVVGLSNVIGIFGFSGNTDPTKGGVGVAGQADPAFPQNFAGFFIGNVIVNGTLTANVKNAVVTFPDRTQRVVHCMESPEHWFEDFGAGKLKGGRAVVKLDADFAKVIKTSGYHVFVTPADDCRGLCVRGKTAKGFEVRELQGGASNVAFSYRIVARRKDITRHRRFARIDTRPPAPKAARRARKDKASAAALRAFVSRLEREARERTKGAGRRGARTGLQLADVGARTQRADKK